MKQVRVEWTEVSTAEYEQVFDVPDEWTPGEYDDGLTELVVGGDVDWNNPVSFTVDERDITAWKFES